MKKIEVRITMRAEPRQIIRAFTDSEVLKDWWEVERSLIDLYVGQPYILVWLIGDQGFKHVTSGVIDAYDREGMIRIRDMVYLNPKRTIFGPMSLTVKTGKTYSGTQVYLCQDGFQSGGDWDWYYKSLKKSWPEMMKKLKDYLEDKKRLAVV